MTANIHGKMFYSFKEPAWHKIVEPSLVPMTAEAILKENFGGGFALFLRPVTVELNGAPVETGDLAIVRGNSPYDPKEMVFGYCTSRYQPLQPIDVAKSFDANVKEYAETMAFLGDGQEMFISWVMPKYNIPTVKGDDEIQMYGIVRTGFDTLKGARLFTSIVRPVCWNTITMAQGWAKANTDKATFKGEVWKGKGVNKNLLRDLGFWMAHVHNYSVNEAGLIANFFGKLAKTPVSSDAEVHEILFEAFPPVDKKAAYFPVQLRDDEASKEQQGDADRTELRDGIFELFAGKGTAITPDYWGVLNATTEYFCNVQASKRPIAESVMFGGRQKNMMRMVKVLSARAPAWK
jgi:hypothetical protein